MDQNRIRSCSCSVPGCEINKKSRPEIGLFTLPTDPRRAECWLQQICLDSKIEPIYVCEEHFAESVINRTNPLKRRLDLDAVPTLKLPPRPDNSSSSTEQADKFEAPLVEELMILKNAWPHSKKKMKIETNAPSRSLDGGALLSLQPNSQPTLAKVCSEISSIAGEVPGQTYSSNAATLSNDSKPKVQPDKFIELSMKEINEGATESQSKDIIVIGEESLEETEQPIINTQNAQTQVQINTFQGEKIDSNEPHGIIKDANTYFIKLHEIRRKMKHFCHSSKAYKQLCLKLYLRFPNEYKSLHKLLDAPPKSELRDVFNDSIISTEKVALFTVHLTQKANTMTAKQKECILCIGELKIKPRVYYDIKKDHLLGIHDLYEVLKPEPATTAVVLILKGIFEEWKQPIAVGYLGKNSPIIRPWVEGNIKSISKIGFNVRAIVLDRDLNYFTKDFNIHKKKAYCINDISFLFKRFYYNFMKSGYIISTGYVAKGQHIVDYYKFDSVKQIPLTPLLSDEILNPASVEELDIKSVMEVFSMTTAAAISAYIDFNLLKVLVKPTVDLIIKMSKLYDILNSGRSDDKTKKGFSGEQSEISFLSEMFELFENITLLNPSGDASLKVSHKNVVENFKTLLRSTLSLWWENNKNCKYEYIPLWRFNTDVVDLFFNQVRKHSKSITKPTAKEVDSIFRQTAIVNLLKNPLKGSAPICKEKVLKVYQTIIKGFKTLNDDCMNNNIGTSYTISSSEYMTLEMRRKDGIIFLAGFLLKKCNEIHKCDVMKTYTRRALCDVETLSMCESIMDDVQKNICLLPSADFIEFVEAMEISLRAFFNKEVLCAPNKKILNSLLRFMDIVNFQMPCDCFPVIYAEKLYCRLRIYHTLKYNNELMRTKICKRIMVNKI